MTEVSGACLGCLGMLRSKRFFLLWLMNQFDSLLINESNELMKCCLSRMKTLISLLAHVTERVQVETKIMYAIILTTLISRMLECKIVD